MTKAIFRWRGKTIEEMDRDELITVINEQFEMLYEATDIFSTMKPLVSELAMRLIPDGKAPN